MMVYSKRYNCPVIISFENIAGIFFIPVGFIGLLLPVDQYLGTGFRDLILFSIVLWLMTLTHEFIHADIAKSQGLTVVKIKIGKHTDILKNGQDRALRLAAFGGVLFNVAIETAIFLGCLYALQEVITVWDSIIVLLSGYLIISEFFSADMKEALGVRS